jgi:hypothetical protein
MASFDDQDDSLVRVMRDLIDAVDRNTDALKSGGGGGGGGSGASSVARAAGGAGGLSKGGGGAGASLGGLAGGAALGAAGMLYDNTIGFAVNATIKAGKRAVKEGVLVGATNAVRLGGALNEGAGLQEAIGAGLETLPIFGAVARDIRGPREKAAQRTKGEFATAFRLGGGDSVPQGILEERFRRNLQEEEGAVAGSKRVDALSINVGQERNENMAIWDEIVKNLKEIATNTRSQKSNPRTVTGGR